MKSLTFAASQPSSLLVGLCFVGPSPAHLKCHGLSPTFVNLFRLIISYHNAVLLGPLRAVSYLLLHGLVAATLGTLWKGGVGWWTSIAISSVVRMVGQLSYLVLRCGRGQSGRARSGWMLPYLLFRCGQGAELTLRPMRVP